MHPDPENKTDRDAVVKGIANTNYSSEIYRTTGLIIARLFPIA